MSRKNRPWLFYDTTGSVCSTCLRHVEAKIIIKGEEVLLEKWCPAHGFERTLICDDAEYYRLCREVYVKHPEMPEQFNTKMTYGCPYDCGLCPDHMQHSCLSVLEITDNCNLTCPVCYAESTPQQQHKPLSDVIAMLDAVVANEGEPDVVQLSGGEPTLHPDFFAILDAAKSRPIKHLMVNTNGLTIATDAAFAERLVKYSPGLEIYLQFDSLHDDTLKQLRGATLAEVHQRTLERLEKFGISTTLVMTVLPGINEDQIGEVIQHALQWKCVRGVTLQPVSEVGRKTVQGQNKRLTVSGIRRAVAEQSQLFTKEDVVPVPCNPDTLAMAYALKLGGKVIPLTRHLGPDALLAGPRNTIVFERDPALKDQVFKLFSTNHSPKSQASCLSDLLCCLPKVAAAKLDYENVFRVLIVQFMDIHNLDLRAVKKSCIHFAQPDGKLIPFESYNLFYRGRKIDQTDMIRKEISADTLLRKFDPRRLG
ncbi:Antilisterial bacteriocin subtilosin biosynthesis protein AlbA [Ferriphaselus amnicola]|uniref:Antilisterial bacteriocin subtilosin biosynthesis protein AlbA n=1 Tax=Ferriphaselus amnicola TaxID=1188319 RepID=A0A2Z6GAE9_9PROT|nr:radical SAM protein [Ferriphaselus amnicola]BBE50436.1 Antilisterial bacteriocin subtilosin biosynthesis protein AlbA [Ferriphaselus amnicola]